MKRLGCDTLLFMPAKQSLPLPAVRALRELGRDLALARRRRGISTEDMAARLFIGRSTLWRLEKGDPNVSLGTLATAAFVLQLNDRLAGLAAPAAGLGAAGLGADRSFFPPSQTAGNGGAPRGHAG